MNQALLHLVDTGGHAVSPAIQTAVEQAHRWVLRDFPRVDPAMIDDWAEGVAKTMEERGEAIDSPKRYAYVALKGRVRDWLRTKAAKEERSGIGPDLERLSGTQASFQETVDRQILFEQLKRTLNERDRYILVLLLEDRSSPAVIAEALDVTYSAAAKAVQRMKERLAEVLNRKPENPGDESAA